MADMDALASYTFQIEIDSIVLAAFKEVSGLEMKVKVITHEENLMGGKTHITKLAGPKEWGDITLKRGKTNSKDLWDWISKVHEGNIVDARRNGSIVLYDYALKEQFRWNFINGWPSKVSVGGLKAGGSEVAVEEVTLTHEGLEVA